MFSSPPNDIQQRFIDAGIQPILPSHKSWFELGEFISMLNASDVEPDIKSIHHVLERWLSKYKTEDRTYGYGLSASPLIETYIKWCTHTNEKISVFICNTQNTVVESPTIIKALQQYVCSNIKDNYEQVKSVILLLANHKKLGVELEKLLKDNIARWSIDRNESNLMNVAELYPYLKKATYIPPGQAAHITMILNTLWPLDDRSTTAIQKHQSWITPIERFEPILSCWLESNHLPDVIITEVYKYLPMVDLTKEDMYSAWLYTNLQLFLNKPDTKVSSQYDDFKLVAQAAVADISLPTRQSWSQQLTFLDSLYDCTLGKAMAMVPEHNLKCTSEVDLPVNLDMA